jgi:inhibitor of the pro-sigma K processing machinery
MHQGWLILLVISTVLLIIVLIRTKIDVRWFGYALLQLVIAAVGLFLINGSGWFGEFHIPVNIFTLFTIGILGIPGLLLLIVIKLTLI